MNFCRNISNSSNAEKTLWKNLNPSSNFGAQTISCDLSNVDFSKSAVILKFKKGAKEEKTYEIRLNEGLNEVCVGSYSYFYWRKYTLSKTGVVVESGGYTDTYPKVETNNSLIIPVELKIRGGGKKSPLFKGFFAILSHFETRWHKMSFCKNILPIGSKSPYPAGYTLKKGTLCTGSSTITAAMLKGCIPLSVKVKGETGNGTVASHPAITTNLGSVQIYNAAYSGSGMYSGPVNGVYDLEMMFDDFLNITQVSFDDNPYGLYNRSITVVKWLEPKGGAQNA